MSRKQESETNTRLEQRLKELREFAEKEFLDWKSMTEQMAPPHIGWEIALLASKLHLNVAEVLYGDSSIPDLARRAAEEQLGKVSYNDATLNADLESTEMEAN